MTETVVPAPLDGERVDRVVALLTGRSRAQVAELVADGRVLIDGKPASTRSRRVQEGEVLAIDLPPLDDATVVDADPDVVVPVVHEDDQVVVVDKPAGLVVHPGSGHEHGTMVNGLLARYPELASIGQPGRPGIVHRLDRGTSGLLVVARTSEAYERLVAQLGAREVHRVYETLVWGHPDATQGVVDAPVGRSQRDPTKMTVTTQGREARTQYRVLRAFDDPVVVSLLECRLETGRTHQIRVHLTAIGHPVVGDQRYGGARQSLALDRPFLHASRLAFDHPTTDERLAFDAPLPEDLERILSSLS